MEDHLAHFNPEYKEVKTIVNPVEYANIAAKEYCLLYKNKLVSVILYGSGAGTDFDPQKSDINLLIVLTSMDIELISMSADLQLKHLRKRFSRPLILDKEYIASSCDSYPMEFLDIKERYKVLLGEDVLSSVSIDTDHLRLQVERELKGKWLHLLEEYTLMSNSSKQLLKLADLSLRAFAPVFRALLTIKNSSVPIGRKELFSTVESIFSIEDTPFQKMDEICKTGKYNDLGQSFTDYARAVKKIIDKIENQ